MMNEYLIKFTIYKGSTANKSMGVYEAKTAKLAIEAFHEDTQGVTVNLEDITKL